ncbi:type II toxin-antitoxin system VapC family toxin [Microlunatus elymi]|uniref:Type II toxin-antitoxin system VapC family toxin n=1 Tax=Microlunatus elymi TaxID=2596828 RepID=A0A516PX80_9ACTN|nr:type II toxin-antitoxin system VapC family toxin [Microlunatus elymi]QDP95762.1 type II toxin-antitoxin system VapC family toxin [Microlunatus elymi]
MSRVLLDTHALLWWFTDDPRLSSAARSEIASIDNQVFVSAASAWEISTKQRLGKLDEVPEATERYPQLVALNGFTPLPVEQRHALTAGSFDVVHRDPFDRMLAAQSKLESLPLVTKDPAFQLFEIETLW